MTTEVTSYSQLNTILNAQYKAIDGDLQESAASSRLQESLQAEIRSWQSRTPPANASAEERAEFFTTKNNALASLRERVADLEASQDPNTLLQRLDEHLEVVKAAKASFAAYSGGTSSVDTNQFDIDQAPLDVGALDLDGQFNISNLSAADITALVTALFRARSSETSAAAVDDPHLGVVRLQREYDLEPISSDTPAGANLTAQLQALEWAPPEFLELAQYVGSQALRNQGLTTISGLRTQLSDLDTAGLQRAVDGALTSPDLDIPQTRYTNVEATLSAASVFGGSLITTALQRLQGTTEHTGEVTQSDDSDGPITTGDPELDALLDTRLSDGSTIRNVLQNRYPDAPVADRAFWGEVAEELFVSNLSASLEDDVTYSVDITESRQSSPEAANQLLKALANLLALLDRAAQRQEENADELLQLLQTTSGQQQARDLVVALTRVIATSFEAAESIAANIGPDEDDLRVQSEIQQQRTEAEALQTRQQEAARDAELALAAADFVYDPATVDNSAQAVISGPGSGRDDVITVRLAQFILEANKEFFEQFGAASQAGNGALFTSISTQADANSARDYTPSYI